MDDLTNLTELNERMKKYSDYKTVTPSQVKYHDIENEYQKELVKKIGKFNTILIAVATVVFIATTVFTFRAGQMMVGILLSVINVILLYLLISSIVSKPKVASGKAVGKQWTYTSSNHVGLNAPKKYYVYFTIDGPEKIICKRVETIKEDYEKIEEGTPILLIKSGAVYCARINANQ